jgi:hypothetical protein
MGVGPSSCMGRRRTLQHMNVMLPGQMRPPVHVNVIAIEHLPTGRWIPEPAVGTKLNDREKQLVMQLCGV